MISHTTDLHLTLTRPAISLRSPSVLLLVAWVALGFAGVDAKAQSSSGASAFATNVKGIQDYDQNAIKRAGNSGNRAYIPYLRSILTWPIYHRSAAEEQAVIALAKLGDSEQLRGFDCDLLSNDPETIHHLAHDILPQVKGWFAIREYFFMLKQDAAYEKELKRPEYNTDAIFGAILPSHWAVRYLPEVVPRPPFARVKDFEDPRIPGLAREWRLWIQQNRERLEQLKPQGQKGLQFSKAGCAAGR